MIYWCKQMPPICLHFEKTVKGYHYGYQMKGLDLRVKNLLLLDQFLGSFTEPEF